jgi:hypothetical protein
VDNFPIEVKRLKKLFGLASNLTTNWTVADRASSV